MSQFMYTDIWSLRKSLYTPRWRIEADLLFVTREPIFHNVLVVRTAQHAVSKLPCLALSSPRSCPSSIYPGHLSTAWLVSLVLFTCHIWSLSGDTRGPSVVFEAVDVPCPGPFHFFSHCWLCLWLLSSPWSICWSFGPCIMMLNIM